MALLAALAQPVAIASAPTSAAAEPSSETAAEESPRVGGAVATGVVSGLALGGTAALLWGRQHRQARGAAVDEGLLGGGDECIDPDNGGCNDFDIDFDPAGVVNRRAFLVWPFLPASAGIGLAMISGHLWGKARPSPRGRALVVAGSVTMAAGATAFLVGRFRRPNCSSLACVDQWFHLDAALYTAGATAMSVGGGLITYGRASARTTVQPHVAFGRDHAELGLSLQF